MKTTDEAFASMLREAMSREEADLFEKLGPPSIFEMLTNLFRGSMRWLNLVGYVLGLIFFALCLYCLYGVFQTNDLTSQLRWGLGFGASLLMVMSLKIWFWLEMHRYAITREIKRLELQVAHLASQRNQTRETDPIPPSSPGS